MWAKMEGALDSINHAIFYIGRGKQIEPEVPESLSRKLRFMRRAHSRLPELKPLQASADRIVDRVHDLKQRRHDMVHGIATRVPTGDILNVIVLRRDKQAPKGVAIDMKRMTAEDLINLFSQIVEIFELAENHFEAILPVVFAKGEHDEGSGLAD